MFLPPSLFRWQITLKAFMNEQINELTTTREKSRERSVRWGSADVRGTRPTLPGPSVSLAQLYNQARGQLLFNSESRHEALIESAPVLTSSVSGDPWRGAAFSDGAGASGHARRGRGIPREPRGPSGSARAGRDPPDALRPKSKALGRAGRVALRTRHRWRSILAPTHRVPATLPCSVSHPRAPAFPEAVPWQVGGPAPMGTVSEEVRSYQALGYAGCLWS